MLEVKEEDIELQQMLRKVESMIAQAKKTNTRSAREPILEKCERDMAQCKNIISRIEIETRDMAGDDRAEVRQMLKERAGRLKELKKDLKWIKNDNDSLLEDESGGLLPPQYAHLDEMKEDQMMEYAKNIQEDDMNILDGVILVVDQTQAQAADVAQKVAEQTEQIGRVGERLDEIDEELERAKRVLKIMLRRVMTDKIVWCFLGLIILAIAGIIAWHVVDGGKGIGTDDAEAIEAE